MLTLKKVKEMVKAPVHTKRVPSPKMLLEEGLILLRKEFEHGSHLTVYNSGYVLFSAGKRNTVFHIHDCQGDYAYDAAEGKGDVIQEEYFENCEWHIRALFEGERKMEESQVKCEVAGQSNVSVSYHAVSEEWGEIADRTILLNFPYIIAFYMVEKAAWLYRHCNGDSVVDRLMVLFMNFGLAYKRVLPSFHPFDLMVGLVGAAALKAVIYFKGKNAKKYRQGEEYGSARWGNQKDIEPFIDPVFENNVILTQTERLMMSGRPKHPKYARNKNVIVIGGSGSGKTRFYVKPNLMQMPQKVSYVLTDPNGNLQ